MTTGIIVNADDLGRSTTVNDRVFELMRSGTITSATVVAGGEALDDVAARCKDHPRCSFGAHLYLTEFQPITPMSEAACLIGPEGRFKDNVKASQLTRKVRQAVAREWIAQIHRLQSAGIPVSHIDSHHHVHTIPALFGVLKHVQRVTGLRKVRISLNCYADGASHFRRLAKALFNCALRHYVATVTTTHFANFAIFHALLERGELPRMATIELMVHPGAATYMTDSATCEEEMACLVGNWRTVLPWPHRLISYLDM
jgi:chitin disaccharide deacetylase